MNALAQGVFQDLRQRRLLPVAALLVIALVAVPLVLLKKSTPAPAVVPSPGIAAAPASASGLPSPQEALNTDKPLVSLAVLEDPSTLSTYRRRNPFKPIVRNAARAGSGASGGGPTSDVAQARTAASSGSSGGSSSSGGGGGGGGAGGTSTTPTPTQSPTTTAPDNGKSGNPSRDGTSKPEKLTYALDLTFTGPNGARRYKNVAKLRMLPSQSQPLFVYLGVDTTGTKAVFLVDSSLTFTDGEGSCSPDRATCATVSLQPGDIANFKNAQNQVFQLQIDQIRTVSAKSAAASARKAARKARVSASAVAADGTRRPKPRRFMPPVITDLFTGASR